MGIPKTKSQSPVTLNRLSAGGRVQPPPDKTRRRSRPVASRHVTPAAVSAAPGPPGSDRARGAHLRRRAPASAPAPPAARSSPWLAASRRRAPARRRSSSPPPPPSGAPPPAGAAAPLRPLVLSCRRPPPFSSRRQAAPPPRPRPSPRRRRPRSHLGQRRLTPETLVFFAKSSFILSNLLCSRCRNFLHIASIHAYNMSNCSPHDALHFVKLHHFH